MNAFLRKHIDVYECRIIRVLQGLFFLVWESIEDLDSSFNILYLIFKRRSKC